ncbi:hypothetical protein RI367_008144 [Sorochytrium milnesiophthora]
MSEDAISRFFSAADKQTADDTSIPAEIAQAIADGNSSVLALVEGMSQQLVNEDAFVRQRAVSLLVLTLESLMTMQTHTLDERAAAVLCQFFTDRLRDQLCVPDLFKGLVLLLQRNLVSAQQAIAIAQALFAEVNIQSFQQTTRYSAFQILTLLVQHHLPTLRAAMESDLLFGFIQAMDGEKDPRNLRLAFALAVVLVKSCNIEKYCEDLFDITFCYFPITFRPPPDDPYGITADDLKRELRQCLCASHRFGPFAMPLLLEKLSSTSASAKKDTLAVLRDGLPVYGPTCLIPHLQKLWSLLKVEIYQSPDQQHEDLALELLRVVAHVLSIVGGSGPDPAAVLSTQVLGECMENLKEPEHKLARVSGRVLRHLVEGSDAIAMFVTTRCMPALIAHIDQEAIAPRRRTLLDVALELVAGNGRVYAANTQSGVTERKCPAHIKDYKDDLMRLFCSAACDASEYSSLRITGLRGLFELVRLSGMLSGNELGIVEQMFVDVLIREQDPAIRTVCTTLHSQIAHLQPAAVLSHGIPAIVQALHDRIATEACEPLLASLSLLADVEALASAVLPSLLTVLDHSLAQTSEHGAVVDGNVLAILGTLLSILTTSAAGDNQFCRQQLVPALVTRAVAASQSPASALVSLDGAEALGRIAGRVMRKCNPQEQSELIQYMFDVFLGQGSCDFRPFSMDADGPQQVLTTVLSRTIGNLRPEVSVPVASLDTFLSEMVSTASQCQSVALSTASSQIVACVLNKLPDSQLNATMQAIPGLQTLLNPDAAMSPLYFWVTKALVMRTNKVGSALVDRLIAALASPEVGLLAAEGFGVVVGDHDDILNRHSFANVKVLYKQRLFNTTLPKIVAGFQQDTSECRAHYLIALSHLLRNIPKQILMSSLAPLMPLLIASLKFGDVRLKTSTMQTLQLTIAETPQVVAHDVDAIAPLLLGMAESFQTTPMAVRIAALDCLRDLTTLKYASLHPIKRMVIKRLAQVLDDPKSLVRRAAVNCRTKWILLSGE